MSGQPRAEKGTCRPRDHLVAAGQLYPQAWRQCEEFRQGRGEDLPDWPDWCFMPLAGWYAIVSADLQVDRLTPAHIGDVARLAALGTWRMTQGIYRFDSDVFASLVDTPVSGDIPVDVLYRMPEWCVYIETPGMAFTGSTLHGFFAHLEHDVNVGRSELRLIMDHDDGLDPVVLHLERATLDECIARATDLSNIHGLSYGLPSVGSDERRAIRGWVEPLLSLLLYLCSENAEVGDGVRRPCNPEPKRTKRGLRLFQAGRATTWDVGVRLGSALRAARRAASDSQGGRHAAPTPHIRRAHWHSFRTGPMKAADGSAIAAADRPLAVRWLPPIPVNLSEPDELSATIRKVR